MKKFPVLWGVSLLTIGVITLIISFSNIFGVELPDVLKIVLGVTDLIALFVLVYTSIRYKVYKRDK